MEKSRAGDLLVCAGAAALLAAGSFWGQVLLFFPAVALLIWRTHRLIDENHECRVPGSLLLICAAFLLPPDLTDDYHRYLWEGFVQNEGYSPYQNAPETLYPLLDHPSEGKVNNAGLTAIYPPLAQYLFRIADVLHQSVYGWKLMVLALSLSLFWLERRALVILSMPLFLVEGIWNAHVDALCLVPGFLMMRGLHARKPWATGMALAVLVAVKIMPVIFVPLCLMGFSGKDRLRFLGAVILPLALIYLPFAGEGAALFTSFVQFSKAWYFNNPFFFFLRAAMGQDAARLVLAGILAASLAGVFFFPGKTGWKLVMAWLLVLVCSPTVHPWYLLWLIPLVPRESLKQLNLAYGGLFLAYLVLVRYRAEGIWAESLWWMIPEWAVLLFFLVRMKKA